MLFFCEFCFGQCTCGGPVVFSFSCDSSSDGAGSYLSDGIDDNYCDEMFDRGDVMDGSYGNMLFLSADKVQRYKEELEIDSKRLLPYRERTSIEDVISELCYDGKSYNLWLYDECNQPYGVMEHIEKYPGTERVETKQIFYQLLVDNGLDFPVVGKFTDWFTTMSLEQFVCVWFDGARIDGIRVSQQGISYYGEKSGFISRGDAFFRCFCSILCVVSSKSRDPTIPLIDLSKCSNPGFVGFMIDEYDINLKHYSSFIPSTVVRSEWGSYRNLLDSYEFIGDTALDIYFMERYVAGPLKSRKYYAALRSVFVSNRNLVMNFIKTGMSFHFSGNNKVKPYANMFEIVVGMIYEQCGRDNDKFCAIMDRFDIQVFVDPEVSASVTLVDLIVGICAYKNYRMSYSDPGGIQFCDFHEKKRLKFSNVFVPLYSVEKRYDKLKLFHTMVRRTYDDVKKTLYASTFDDVSGISDPHVRSVCLEFHACATSSEFLISEHAFLTFCEQGRRIAKVENNNGDCSGGDLDVSVTKDKLVNMIARLVSDEQARKLAGRLSMYLFGVVLVPDLAGTDIVFRKPLKAMAREGFGSLVGVGDEEFRKELYLVFGRDLPQVSFILLSKAGTPDDVTWYQRKVNSGLLVSFGSGGNYLDRDTSSMLWYYVISHYSDPGLRVFASYGHFKKKEAYASACLGLRTFMCD